MSDPAIVYVSGTTDAVKVTSSGGIDLVQVTTTYGGSSGTSIIVSDTAPTSPTDGMTWLDSTDGVTSTYSFAQGVWISGQEEPSQTGGYDPLAYTYFADNSISDATAKDRINAALAYLRSQSMVPDDAAFLRSNQQPSATSPVTLRGVTGASGGTPVMAAGGITYDGNDSSYWTFAAPVTAFTVVSELRGVTSGQTAIGALIQLTGSASPNTGTQMLTYTEAGASRVYSKQGATSSVSDNTNVGTILAPFLLDNWSAFECVAGLSYDGAATPTVQIAIDGIAEITDASGMTQCTSDLDRLVIAGQMTGASTFALQPKIRNTGWLLYSRVLTDAEFVIASRAIRMLDPRRNQLLAWGDSLSTNIGTESRAGDSWPLQFGSGSSWDAYLRVQVSAQGGKMSTWGSSNYGVSVTPWKPDGGVCDVSVMTVLFGTNDVYSGGATGAAIAASILDVVALAKADGHYVILISCPPDNASMGGDPYDVDQLARWTDLHNAQVADQGLADAFLNLSDIDVIGEGVDAFWFNAYHFNAAGNKMISERIAALLPFTDITIPKCTTRPTISGSTTRTATTGTWANTPTSYAYQWYREATAIGGATSAAYVLTGDDTGHRIFCRVTATNASGSQSASTDLTATI